ncbi:MAG: hypothetical protein RIS29_2502 [Bacteroidota bacterium]|jgi:hypothetical protein
MREYKLARGWKIFTYICFPVFIGLLVWLGVLPFTETPIDIQQAYYLVPISLGGIVYITLGIVDAIKLRIILYNDRIVSVSALSKRELINSEVKGYQILLNSYIEILPLDNIKKKKIQISPAISLSTDLIVLLDERFTNLDNFNYKKEENELNNQLKPGYTEEEYKERIVKAGKLAKFLNYLGLVMVVVAMFAQTFYEFQVIFYILYPFVVFAVAYKYKGIIRIVSTEMKSPYPNVSAALLMSVLGLIISSLKNFNVYDYSNLWGPALLISSILILYYYRLTGSELYNKYQRKSIYPHVLVSVVILFFVGFSYISINCKFDHSVSTVYRSQILDKQIYKEKYVTSYFVIVDKWGKESGFSKMPVPKSQYDTIQNGDSITIQLKKGLLDIPWVFVYNE